MHGVLEQSHTLIVQNAASITFVAGAVGGAILLGLVLHSIFFYMIRSLGRHRSSLALSSLARHTSQASRWLIVLLAVNMVLPLVPGSLFEVARSVMAPLIILTVAWLLIRLIDVLEDLVLQRYTLGSGDLKARRINTQFQLLKRILIITIVVFAVGTILMTFDRIRQLGATILASAGIIGIIVGVAAQRSVANLLAGIQIALTEPIRLGDSVVVENEFGVIEEITLTYVVVKIWDNRRLVLPIVYFIEKPFQNWTREHTHLLGTVFLYTDYTVPVEALRTEFDRLVHASSRWDGQTAAMQVTNLSGNSVEIRALVSAAPENLWDLRCEIREKLVDYVQRNYPESLPKFRAEIRNPGDPSDRPA